MNRARALCIIALLTPDYPFAATPSSPSIHRVWVGPRPEFDDIWALSRDGRLIAFRDEQSRIAIYDTRASRVRVLQKKLPAEQWRAAFSFSRDSLQVAFNRATQRGEDLVVIDSRGSSERVIAHIDGNVAAFGWSADATRIAVAIERGTTADLAWVSINTGQVRPILTVPNAVANGRSFSAVLSPDSKQIAFTRLANGRSRDIFNVQENGEDETAAVVHPADDQPVGFTKSGQLLFTSDRSGTIGLWAVPAANASGARSVPHEIRRNLGVIRPMTIIEPASDIYYTQSECSADVFTVPLTSAGNVSPAPFTPVTSRFATYNSGPDWSPSGQEMVFQVGQPGTPDGIDLAFVSPRNRQEHVVHPDLLQFSRPRYMPDGLSVVVHGVGLDGIQGIYQIDRQSGKSTLIARSEGEDLANPVPRGTTLFFERGGYSIRALQRGSDPPFVVYESRTRNANFASAPSPDGKAVALVDGASLIVVEVGGTVREILSLKSGEQFHPFPGSLEWTADGRSVLFAKIVGRNREVWRVPAMGGHSEPIGLSVRDQALYFLRNNSNGRNLAFVVGDCDLRPREVWVLKHFVSDRRVP